MLNSSSKRCNRNDQYFTAMIFWRDFREIGASLVLVALFLYLGVKTRNPGRIISRCRPWYGLPGLCWETGCDTDGCVRDGRAASPARWRVRWRTSITKSGCFAVCTGGLCCRWPLRCSRSSARSPGKNAAGAGGRFSPCHVVVTLAVGVLAGVFWLNLYAIRAELEPRRRELETLLRSLGNESPDAHQE